MVIFHSYLSLPKGNIVIWILISQWITSSTWAIFCFSYERIVGGMKCKASIGRARYIVGQKGIGGAAWQTASATGHA